MHCLRIDLRALRICASRDFMMFKINWQDVTHISFFTLFARETSVGVTAEELHFF